MNLFKKFLILSPVVVLFIVVYSVHAAAPDGAGPWADTVVSSAQGLMKNGGAVPAVRSNPASALGVAENNTTDGNFFSLGFGGNLVLGFDNGISNGTVIVEATNPGYPGETARIEMSENGVTWVMAGNVVMDGTVAQPEGVACAKFVRITDISDPAIMPDDIADGYDVDGVQAQGESCTPAQSPSPSPSVSPSVLPSPSESASATPTPTPAASNPPGLTDPGPPGPQGPSTGGAPAANTAPGFPNTGGTTGNPLIPRFPNTGIGPEEGWNISSALNYLMSIISKALSHNS